MKSSLRFVVLLVLIIGAGALVNAWAYLGEARVERKELAQFPSEVGAWRQGKVETLDAETMKVLRASDYLIRDYRRGDGQFANFYVGYYKTQRDGASFHSPLNCMPGTGWVLASPDLVSIPTGNGESFIANKYLIQNGDYKSVMIYWYQGRGRAVASEYWGKIYTVIDSVRLRRSDGAIVRVTSPVITSEETALATAIDLASAMAKVLPEFVPN
jgi:EpsI family protein